MSFGKFGKHKQAWYPLIESKKIKKKSIKPFNILGKKLMIFRSEKNSIVISERTCPHLGADLSDGKIISSNCVKCPFHGYNIMMDKFGKSKNTLSVRTYPATEKWGFIWIFNGSKPTFELPEMPEKAFIYRPPSQIISCHPHLVIGNGLDISHYHDVHGLKFISEPILSNSKNILRVSFQAKIIRKRLSIFKNDIIKASFTALGANMAIANITSPVEFQILFTGIDTGHSCKTQTFFFLPKSLKLIKAFGIRYYLLHDDVKILNKLNFTPNFRANDVVLKEYYNMVNQIPENE